MKQPKIKELDFSYQEPLIKESLENLIKEKKSLLAACPGAGKTNMAIEIIDRFLEKFPEKKVLVLTHGQEILRNQFVNRMIDLNDFGFEEVKSRKKITGTKKVIVSLPQTIFNRLHEIKCDLIVIDEAHQYYGAKMLKSIIERTGADYILLLTGTPSKFIGKMPIAYITLSDLLEKGILFDPKIILEEIKLDINFSDYETKKMELPLNKVIEGVGSECVQEIINKNDKHVFQKCLIICRNQRQAFEINDFLNKKNFISFICTSSFGNDSKKTFELFKNRGSFLVVVNRGILGFDYPGLTSIIDLTLSLNINRIFQQVCRLVRKSSFVGKAYFKVYGHEVTKETKETLLAVVGMAYKDGYLLSHDKLKRISLDKKIIDRFGLFNDSQIKFSSISSIIKTHDILTFQSNKPNLTSLQEVVCHNIKRIREESGLTQDQLSKKTGMTIRYLIKIQNNPSNITLETLNSIAIALNTPLVEFFI